MKRGYTSSGPILRAFAEGLTPAERAKVSIGPAPAIADRETYVALFGESLGRD